MPSRDDLVKAIKAEFEKFSSDRNFLIGFLLAGMDDKCIELPEGWVNDLTTEELKQKASEAFTTAAIKMMSGETLPSELMPMPPDILQ